ncbi:MAG: hypothetical protein P1U61_00675 [Legionellaceae bacterium]|nr:hypothetical protein [Legionellaceae bacterium]
MDNISKKSTYASALKAFRLSDFNSTITLCSEIIDTDSDEIGRDQITVGACALRGRAHLELFKLSGDIAHKISEMEDSLRGRFYELDEASVLKLDEKTNALPAVLPCNATPSLPASEESLKHEGLPNQSKNAKNKAKARAKVMFEQGDEHRLNGNDSAALDCYTQSIEIYGSLAAYQGRILVNLERRESEAVFHDCDMIDKIDRVESLFLRGSAQIALGLYVPADETFTDLMHAKSKKTTDNLIGLKLHIGKLFRAEQQLDMAKKYILEALVSDSMCPLVRHELSCLTRSYALRGAKRKKEGDHLKAKIDHDEAKSLQSYMPSASQTKSNSTSQVPLGLFNGKDTEGCIEGFDNLQQVHDATSQATVSASQISFNA